MAIQYKGPQYLNIARQSAIRSSENKQWWQKSLMSAIEDKDDQISSNTKTFFETIGDNLKLQKAEDAAYSEAESSLEMLGQMSGWMPEYDNWAMKHLINKTKTYKQIEDHVLNGDLIPISKKEVEVASLPNEFYTKISHALAESESSNRWDAKVELGADNKGCPNGQALGKWQFTTCHLDTFRNNNKKFKKMTNSQFLKSPELQKKVMDWHLKDIHKFIGNNKLDSYIGKTINGVEVTREGMIAVAHLGGKGGLRAYLKGNGHSRTNKSDKFGTSLHDYMKKFGKGESSELKDDDKNNIFNQIFGMFSNGDIARKKAIKLAVKHLGISEASAEEYLDGKLFSQSNLLGESKVTVGGKLPDLSGVKTLSDWNAMNVQLSSSNLQKNLGKKKYETLMKNFNGLKETILKTTWQENISDPKFIMDLTFEEAKMIKEAAASKKIDLDPMFTKKYEQLEKQYNGIALIPELPTSYDSFEKFKLKTIQAYNAKDYESLPKEVRDYVNTIELSLSEKSTIDGLQQFDSADDLLFSNLAMSPAFQNADEEEKKKMVLNLTNEIAKAKNTSTPEMPTSMNEALYIVLDNTGNFTEQHKTMAKKFLEYDQNINRPEVMVWMKITNDYIENNLPDQWAKGKREGDFKNFAITKRAIKYVTNDGTVKYVLPGSDKLINAVEIKNHYGKISDDAKKDLGSFSQNNNQVHNAYNRKLEATYKFQKTANNILDLVEENEEILSPFTAGVAMAVEGISIELNNFTNVIKETFASGNLPTRENADGTTEEYIPRSQIEEFARDNGILEGNETFESLVNSDLGKLGDVARGRRRFLAESVLLIFRTGVQEGQTGQGMSNKDFERFAAFVRGFKDKETFEASLKTFMQGQYASLDIDANLINNPEMNAKFEDFKSAHGYIPLRGIVPTLDDYILKSKDDDAKKIKEYFLGTESRFEDSSTGSEQSNVFEATSFMLDGVFNRDKYEEILDAAGIEVGQSFTIRKANGETKTYTRAARQ